MSVFVVLTSDVRPDHRLIKSNHGHKITSGPEILTREVLRLSRKSPRYRYRTLSFDIPNHIRHRVLRRNADTDMHVIRHQMAFHNLAFLLYCQLSKYLAKMLSDRSKYQLLPPLRYKYHVILAVPFRMTKTLVIFYLILLTFDRVRTIRLTVALGQTLGVPRQSRGITSIIYLGSSHRHRWYFDTARNASRPTLALNSKL